MKKITSFSVPWLRSLLSSVVSLLFSVVVILTAIWTVQVMSSEMIRVRGDRLLEKGSFEQAEPYFKRAEQIDPQNWQTQCGLGQIYYQYRYNELDPVLKQEWAVKEQAAYNAAYRGNPVEQEVTYGLGRVELFLGNRDKGLDYLRQAANYMRFNDFYWRKLGIELRKAGLYDEARAAFEYALTLDRSNPTVLRNLKWLDAQKPDKK